MKFHISLVVENLQESKHFYTLLFGEGPVKEKEGYLKFDPKNIPLNISFHEGKNINTQMHLGIECINDKKLLTIYNMLHSKGLITKEMGESNCCFAKQNKFWITDPSGYLWEIYTLEENLEEFGTLSCDPQNNIVKRNNVANHCC